MKTRLAILALIASAVAGGCNSYGILGGDDNDGVLPDTLPLTISDSVVTFSDARSAVYVGDTVSVFFSVKNNSAQPLLLLGSSGCTFTVRAYNASGALVSPVGRACTEDAHQWGTIAPGASFVHSFTWTANTSGGGGGTTLPAGVYDLEGFVDANGFQRTGRKLKFQVFNR